MKAFTYDAIGNLTSKSDIGTYSYPARKRGRLAAAACGDQHQRLDHQHHVHV